MPDKELSPIQKLDETLKAILAIHDPIFYSGREKLSDYLNNHKIGIEHSELQEILEKLKRDEYIDLDMQGMDIAFKLRFEGRYFTLSGGYAKEQSDKDLSRQTQLVENDRNRLNQILLTIGAIGAAVGAISLVAWDMVKTFLINSHHHHFH